MEFTVSSSYIFNELIQSGSDLNFDARASLGVEDGARHLSPPLSPSDSTDSPGDMKLYLPTAPPSADAGQLSDPGQASDADLDRLIAVRNLFAFLTGQPLVATKRRPTIFQAFLQIASLLEEFGFTSPYGASFGAAVDLSFEFYVDQLGLADCRHSREKTVEALVLGERMRNVDLYNEAFAHAAGKYSAIADLKLPIFSKISKQTQLQLEKAHLNLVTRQHGVNQNLEQFDFPSLFAGIASSTSNPDLKHVRFKIWRNSFSKMRSLVLSHYKSTFGSWPPKASSSKNPFAESGLNRLVLKTLYSDMCALYDLLVDRDNLTTRIIDEAPPVSGDKGKTAMSVLRCMLSEFDRSRPPVLPPIPYDMPLVPSMTTILETYPSLSTKEQIKFEKSLKDHEMLLVLNKAYNYDASRAKVPFLDKFKEFELREAKGKLAPDLLDQRVGYWLFLYVVIQSLPMLVVDAPGLKFTEGTEYFLCEPPQGNPPWVEHRAVRKMWYEVAGGGRLVELSEDAILFSIEATYHRSHCWLAAKRWQGAPDIEEPPFEEPGLGPLEPPPPVLQVEDGFVGGGGGALPPARGASPTLTPPPASGSPPVMLRPRNLSPGGSRASRMSHAYRSSMAIGLEPVPLEPPSPFGSHNRSSSVGPRPPSANLGSRSRSMVNLAAASQQQGRPGGHREDSPTDVNTGATFDDILGETATKKAAPKKKGFFF